MNIKDIKLNSHNPRDITPEQFAKLKKSLQEFPQMLETRPLVIDENNVVLGGNMRLRVLQELGFEDVPVKQVKGWTEEQKKEFIVKDNLSYGMWDWEMLANEWDAEQLEDWGLKVEGWEEEKLEAQEDNFEVPDEIQTDIQLGDIIEIGEHRLMCGDSTDSDQVAKLMNGERADMVFTDPPYNLLNHKIETGLNPDDLFNQIKLFSKENIFIAFFGQHPTIFEFLKSAYNIGFEYKNEIIWDKLLPSNVFQDILRTHENCFILINGNDKKNFYEYNTHFDEWLEENHIIKSESVKRELNYWKAKANGKDVSNTFTRKEKQKEEYYNHLYEYKHQNLGKDYKRIQSVWHIYRDSFSKKQKGESLHVTQKPIEFISRICKMTSKNNDLVLDLFLGSGSTMVASHQLNRKCYGMELDPKYCQVIVDRMKKLDPEIVIKINGELYITGN